MFSILFELLTQPITRWEKKKKNRIRRQLLPSRLTNDCPVSHNVRPHHQQMTSTTHSIHHSQHKLSLYVSLPQQLVNAWRYRVRLGQHFTTDFPVRAFSPRQQSVRARPSIWGEMSLRLVAIFHNPVEPHRSICVGVCVELRREWRVEWYSNAL